MIDLHALAQEYSFDPQKPHFPVNSLRLLYFLILDHFTQKNPTAREKISQLTPKVEAIIAARSAYQESTSITTRSGEYQTIRPHLEGLFAIIDTPVVRQTLDQFLTHNLPLLDDIMTVEFQALNSNTTLTVTDLGVILKSRAMDSLIFSTLINEIIRTTSPDTASLHSPEHPAPLIIHHHINLAFQLNDLVDMILFAKDDLEETEYSPFSFIQKIAPQPSAAKELIRETIAQLQQQSKELPFPKPLQEQVEALYTALSKVVIS